MFQKILIYSGIAVLGLVSLGFFIKFFKRKIFFLWSSILGMIALVGVNLVTYQMGIALGYSALIILVTVLFGLPGVALMLLVKLL